MDSNLPNQQIQSGNTIIQTPLKTKPKVNESKFRILIKIFNVLIVLYLFISALMLSFSVAVTLPFIFIHNQFTLGYITSTVFAILYVFAFVIFLISKKRHIIVLWILSAIFIWSTGLWIYNKNFSIGSFLTYVIPIVILLIIKYLKKRTVVNLPNSKVTTSINPTSQPSVPLSTPPSNVFNNNQPFWQKETFIILFILIFWPLGIFLMWKYTNWRRWFKEVLTIFYILSIIPTIFFYTIFGTIKGYGLFDNFTNPKTVNESKDYNCKPSNDQWNKCTNNKYGFSFEYPSNWNFVDEGSGYIKFGPNKDVLDNYLISFSYYTNWDDEIQAKKFVDGIIPENNREKIDVNELYATKEKTQLDTNYFLNAFILNGKITYKFNTTLDFQDYLKATNSSIKIEEVEAIFDHMLYSFSLDSKNMITTITPIPDETANWKTYQNSYFNFSIKYPSLWNYVEEEIQALVNSTSSGTFNRISFYPKGVTSGYICELYPENERCDDPRIFIDIKNSSFSSPSSSFDEPVKTVYAGDTIGYYYFHGMVGGLENHVYLFPIQDGIKTLEIFDVSYGSNAIKKINKEKSVNIEDADSLTFDKMVKTLRIN